MRIVNYKISHPWSFTSLRVYRQEKRFHNKLKSFLENQTCQFDLKQAKSSKVIMVSSLFTVTFFKQPKQFLQNNMILNLKIPNN